MPKIRIRKFEPSTSETKRCSVCGLELKLSEVFEHNCQRPKIEALGPPAECIHRGEELETGTCDLCGLKGQSFQIYSCSIHGKCSLTRKHTKVKSCGACDDFKPKPSTTDRDAVSVAIICPPNGYGKYLEEAIDSVLAQTHPAAEILVVDDATTDETAEVAKRYSDRVKYHRIHIHKEFSAQRVSFEMTSSPFLVMLDADDMMDPDYLKEGLPFFKDPRVGIVHADLDRFGDETGLLNFTPPSGIDLYKQNACISSSIVRRSALDQSGCFDPGSYLSEGELQDWFMWRRVIEHGWRLEKNKVPLKYRKHADSWQTRLRREGGEAASYFKLGSLSKETITIFVPLSGRTWAWPTLQNFLETQSWPHEQIRLVLCDSSNDPIFEDMIRSWVLKCDYKDFRYYKQKLSFYGFADKDRSKSEKEVGSSVSRIYSRMVQEATTEYIFVVEDDIVPPTDVILRLMKNMNSNVASVSAVYEDRRNRRKLVVWDKNRQLFNVGSRVGVHSVEGSGFGCVILRRSVLREFIIDHSFPTKHYDVNYFINVKASNRKYEVFADFDIMCEHLSAPKSS